MEVWFGMKGVVEKWFGEKGFGFIRRLGTSESVFVHYTDIQSNGGFRKLEEGQTVKFDVEHGAKGAKAVNVCVIGE